MRFRKLFDPILDFIRSSTSEFWHEWDDLELMCNEGKNMAFVKLQIMVMWVVYFPREGYEIRQTFGQKSRKLMYFVNMNVVETSKIDYRFMKKSALKIRSYQKCQPFNN